MTKLTIDPTLSLAVPITTQIDKIKYNPVTIQTTILDHLELITGKTIDIVDPTNPFISLLELSAMNTSSSVSESLTHLRELYPSLSQNSKDLYNHLSDTDYINIFATPSTGIMTLTVSALELFNYGVVDVVSNSYKLVTIPRNTYIYANNVYFTTLYPINIKLTLDPTTSTSLGIYEVSYDTSLPSPLQNIYTSLIEHFVLDDSEGNTWLSFKVPLKQFKTDTLETTVVSGNLFKETIELTDEFLNIDVYNKSATTNGLWEKIVTTHSDMIYDPTVPTAKIVVLGTTIEVSIPAIYTATGMISNLVRIDVHTTKGKIFLPLKGISISEWKTDYTVLDVARDSNIYTAAMENISLAITSTDTLDGGRNALTYDELRARVLQNTTGPISIPITEKQLHTLVNDLGYSIYKSYDIVTDRLYIVNKELPYVTTSLDEVRPGLTHHSLHVTEASLLTSNAVFKSLNRLIIKPNTVFKVVNDVVTLASDAETAIIQSLSSIAKVRYFLDNELYYIPYYYVLDRTNNELETRAYYLDSVNINSLTFISANGDTGLMVNTASYNIVRTATSYILTLTTISNDAYKAGNIKINNIYSQTCQLKIPTSDPGENIYITSSSSVKLTSGERQFVFVIDTNYDIDETNKIRITNGVFKTLSPYVTLNPMVEVFYLTADPLILPTGYVANSEINLTNLPTATQAISKELLNITLGTFLGYLSAQSKLSFNANKYLKHLTALPAVYPEDVYAIDPTTKTIFSVTGTVGNYVLNYTKTHLKGDPVLDALGNPSYVYNVGDVVLDAAGAPVIDVLSGVDLKIDLMLLEAEYLYAEDPTQIANNKLYLDTITGWLNKDLPVMNDSLLELTKIEYIPNKTSGTVLINDSNNTTTAVPARITPILSVYVDQLTMGEPAKLGFITSKIEKIIEEAFNKPSINLSEVRGTISTAMGSKIKGVKIDNLNPSITTDLIILTRDDERIKIGKKYVVDMNNNLLITRDIQINFILI